MHMQIHFKIYFVDFFHISVLILCNYATKISKKKIFFLIMMSVRVLFGEIYQIHFLTKKIVNSSSNIKHTIQKI